jgi:HSP20 family protein
MLSYWIDPRVSVPFFPSQPSRRVARAARDWHRPTPCYEVVEKSHGLLLRLEVPGFGPGELDVQAERGILKVTSRQSSSSTPEGKFEAQPDLVQPALSGRADVAEATRLRRNIDFTFRIGDDINVENITGSLLNGILELELPRKAEAQPRQVPVRTASV